LTTSSRSGLRVTTSMSDQFLVVPDQRAGWRSWAWRYSACVPPGWPDPARRDAAAGSHSGYRCGGAPRCTNAQTRRPRREHRPASQSPAPGTPGGTWPCGTATRQMRCRRSHEAAVLTTSAASSGQLRCGCDHSYLGKTRLR